MFIKSKHKTNPVLLYLHGGLPDYFLTRRYPTGLEDYFTVVWWEQRGSGLSYSPDIPRATLTLEQFISDTLDVTNYLRHRFGQNKIYLMGHSGGSFIGIQAVARAPELYHAYIGVAQMSNQLESERLASVDAERLGRVLHNLLGNAQKYGRERGTISVTLDDSATEVRISVTDDGPGIPPDDQERIFERFYRVTASGSAGSGLGLAIARGLVELHGGQVWVESTPGRGSTFHVDLPVD